EEIVHGEDAQNRSGARRWNRQGDGAGSAESARRRLTPIRLRPGIRALRLVLRDLQEDRCDDADRWDGEAGTIRFHTAGWGWLAGCAGPYLAVGPADPDPPRLRPICEPAAVQVDARRADAACRPHRG